MFTSITCRKVALLIALSQVLLVFLLYYRRVVVAREPAHSGTQPRPAILDDPEASAIGAPPPGNQIGRPVEARDPDGAPTLARNVSIAVGLAMTTRKLPALSADSVMTMPFFRSLMASFCRTASDGYAYHFYVAHDHDDAFLSNRSFAAAVAAGFRRITGARCPGRSSYALHFVRCPHAGRPAWAQNDAMIEAYLAGSDYFYRINDDTVMTTASWTEAFVGALAAMTPPRLGVVGPNHRGGNIGILTYDFTWRAHIDVHGFYYPREFRDWYADRWITSVYKPGRSRKLRDVQLVHTMETGQRYKRTEKTEMEINWLIERDRATVLRYAVAAESGFQERDPRKVIAMSLYGGDSAHTWGAIRNAQLVPVVYPGWTLEIYTNRSLLRADGERPGGGTNRGIPERVVRTLRSLNARIVYVDELSAERLPPGLWSYLVADRPDVDVFVVRAADGRLTERDRAVVEHWLGSRRPDAVLAVRDHPKHANASLVDGLWGARSKPLRALLAGASMLRLIRDRVGGAKNASLASVDFLERLYSIVQDDVIFYDSVSCERPRSVAFPVLRKQPIYVGQKYDAHEQPVENEKAVILRARNPNCEETS